MPSLWDVSVQLDYADACLKLEEDWDTLIPAVRENRFKLAVNELARAIQMPEFVFHFSKLAPGTMGNLDFTQWRMNMSSSFTQGESAGTKGFYKFCSTLYHEAHHGEQWFRCVQGVARGTFPLPLLGRGAKAVSARVAGNEAKDIAEYMWVPLHVVNRAQATRMMFPTAQVATIRAWYDSIYGVRSAYRNGVLNTMSHSGIDGYKRYLSLAEEVDAWNLERQFRGRLKEKARAAGEAWAMSNLASLFD
jgi:hypothetical protein